MYVKKNNKRDNRNKSNVDLPRLEGLSNKNENLPYYRRIDEGVGESLYRDHLNRVQRTEILKEAHGILATERHQTKFFAPQTRKLIQEKLEREIEQLVMQELGEKQQNNFMNNKKVPDNNVAKEQLTDLLSKLDILQTFPYNKKAKTINKASQNQHRAQKEKDFVEALWEDFFEIMKVKPQKEETPKDVKKTPRRNWDVKKEIPISKVVVIESFKVLINPYLDREEKA